MHAAIGELVDEVRHLRRMPTPALARAIRESAGLSQARVAEALGVDRVTVTRWETGRRRPRGQIAREYVALIEKLRVEVGA